MHVIKTQIWKRAHTLQHLNQFTPLPAALQCNIDLMQELVFLHLTPCTGACELS